ncbi:hypothetical protein JG677_07675 [Campylobacter sp. TTU-622]|nr:hypothetical protein [Campylobacter sp. TTU-622]EFS0701721.1 hypothetical protein [Campylobacter jejuni]EHS1057281.1 hypothetical protein [Campylobacter jejuni]EHS1059166.1 hypothetical protein [Campylobacter jejuni]EHS1060917.1 hypothetical protein [Campylobacter jejuni]EHT1801037.1 hypothetical protein [Campylobacter jejuni]
MKEQEQNLFSQEELDSLKNTKEHYEDIIDKKMQAQKKKIKKKEIEKK